MSCCWWWQELGEKVATASRSVQQFRQRLNATKNHVRTAHINTLRLLMQRQNLRRLLKTLDTISTVSKTQSTIQYLLAGGEYNRALHLIHTTQEVVETDLHSVHAVRHMAHQLTEIKALVGKMVDGDLVAALMDHAKAAVPAAVVAMQVERGDGEGGEGGEGGSVHARSEHEPSGTGKRKKKGKENGKEKGKESKEKGEPCNADDDRMKGGVEGEGEEEERSENGDDDDEADEADDDDDVEAVDALLGTVHPLLTAVAQQQQQIQVLSSYENSIIEFVRGLVKDVIVAFLKRSHEHAVQRAMTDPTQIASWGDSLRLLSFESWLELLAHATRIFVRLLRRVVHNHDAVALTLRDLTPAPQQTLKGGSASSNGMGEGEGGEKQSGHAGESRRQSGSPHIDGRQARTSARGSVGDDGGDGGDSVDGGDSGGGVHNTGGAAAASAQGSGGGTRGRGERKESEVSEQGDEDMDDFVSDALADVMEAGMADLVDVDVARRPERSETAGDSGAKQRAADVSSAKSPRSARREYLRSLNASANAATATPAPNTGSHGSTIAAADNASSNNNSNDNNNSGDSSSNSGDNNSGSSGSLDTFVLSRTQYDQLVETNRRVVRRVVEELFSRLSKVLQARARDGGDARVAVAAFTAHYSRVWAFQQQADAICDVNCGTLRVTLSTQVWQALGGACVLGVCVCLRVWLG